MENRIVTIMFVDMQGYTRRSASQTFSEMKLFHDDLKGFVQEQAGKHDGVLVKCLGDGFLVRFDLPSRAIQCGLEMQCQLQARNAHMVNPEHLVRFRIGINTGEVGIDENGDLFGDPVNIASRIQGFAEPNEVFISEATYLAMNRNEFGAQDLGPQQFKNATREIRVYKILPKGEGGGGALAYRLFGCGPAAVLRRHWVTALLALLLLLTLLALGNANRRKRAAEAGGRKAAVGEAAAASLAATPPGGTPAGISAPAAPVAAPGAKTDEAGKRPPPLGRRPPKPRWEDLAAAVPAGEEAKPGAGLGQLLQRRAAAQIQTLRDQGEYGKAIVLLELQLAGARKHNLPIKPNAYLALGELYLENKQPVKANEAFAEALRLVPAEGPQRPALEARIAELRQAASVP